MSETNIFDRLDHVKFFLRTYGCQMNEQDSEILRHQLRNLGAEETSDENEADIILLNSCTVRQKADEKVLGKLGSLKALKEVNENLILILCGCLAQDRKEWLLKNTPADIVFGPQDLPSAGELILKCMKEKGTKYAAAFDEGNYIPNYENPELINHYKASVTIISGCNNFCSYCIVPYVRGRERSRSFDEIVSEVRTFIERGVKEITLLGQNVNSYGNDLKDPRATFSNLLKTLNDIEGEFWLRFITSHPKDFSDEVIEVMANCRKICRYIHLPVQAGSNHVLELMNRGYSVEDYCHKIDKIREKLPDCAISTDMIAGFPGETREDFEETLKILEKIRYDGAFLFYYSVRKGTKAETLPDLLPKQERIDRLKEMILVQNKISEDLNDPFVGKTLTVLCEGTSKKNSEMLVGHSELNRTVLFQGDLTLEGTFVKVKINRRNAWTLYGDLVKE